MNMPTHKVFGNKENAAYYDREGAYLIPVDGEKIGVIKTPRGFFLLGGGIEENETDSDCIKRECIEETGFTCEIKGIIASAETYTHHSKIGYFHPIQRYYYGELKEKISQPTENDHTLVWVSYNEIKNHMYAEMQNWAIDELFIRNCSEVC